MPNKIASEIKYATIFFLEALTMRTHSCDISILSVKIKFEGLTVKLQYTFLTTPNSCPYKNSVSF